MLTRLLGIASSKNGPSGPKGSRAYAIGDVHGRLDLLDGMLQQIAADHRDRGGKAKPLLLLLGDLIDRGPESAGVVERVMRGPLDGFRTAVLTGNHEEVLLRLLDGDERGLFVQWLRFGGAECINSYGGDPLLLASLPEEKAIAALKSLMPLDHLDFLRSLADTFRFGDYLFVHAGIRPGIAIEDQSPHDLRWIRGAFLNDRRDHGVMVVHGHTISERIEERPNRIGIDTGAYQHGVLTALAVEDEERWFLQQHEAIATSAGVR